MVELTPQAATFQCRERVIKPVARFTYDQTTETSSAACERSRARSKRKQTKQENLSAKAPKIADDDGVMSPAPNPSQICPPNHTEASKKIGYLASFFIPRPPTLGQVQASHAAASVLRVVEKTKDTPIDQPAKKRGGDRNRLDQTGAKKLKVLLSKGHSIEICKGMIDTSRPVKEKRME